MKKFLFIILSSFLFLSCEDSAVSGGRKMYQRYFYEILKDPQSFVVYKESFEKENDIAVKWNIEYGAKNGFGGMVRETAEFTTIGGTSILINHSFWEYKDGKMIKSY